MKPPAPGPVERALRDPRDERGRDAGVDGVAALGQHLGPRLGGERMSCCDGATHRGRLLRAGRYPRRAAVTRTSVVRREADSRRRRRGVARGGARLARPARLDLAEHAYQRTLFLNDGFALWNNFWYAGRYSFVTYSVLYYPLAALLGIRLLAVATVSTAALAFAVVVWRAVGADRTLVEPDVRRRLGGIVFSAAFPFALGAALALLAIWALQARPLLALRRARGADARGQPARLPAADAAAGRRSGSRAGRTGARCSRPR